MGCPLKMPGKARTSRGGPASFWMRGRGSIAEKGICRTTLEPDGQAAGCKPVEVGSTPTGVSGGIAHPRRAAAVFQASGWSRRARGASAPSPDGRQGVFRAGIRNRGGIRSW